MRPPRGARASGSRSSRCSSRQRSGRPSRWRRAVPRRATPAHRRPSRRTPDRTRRSQPTTHTRAAIARTRAAAAAARTTARAAARPRRPLRRRARRRRRRRRRTARRTQGSNETRATGRRRTAGGERGCGRTTTIARMPVLGMLGLGEAGGLIAADLRAAGATVQGYDPLPHTLPDVTSPTAAAAGAEVVLSLTTAAEALEAAWSVLTVLRPGQVYADANTAGSALKEELAALVAPTGAVFADVALMTPVPGHGVRTPAAASGPGADA